MRREATFADSPAWEPVRPEWPGHLPGVPDKGQATTAITPVVMPAPLVECSPATASAPVPSVAAGPEIFNVTPGPAVASQARAVRGLQRVHARLLTVAHQNLPGLK